MVLQIKKKILKFPKFYNFENHQISIIVKQKKNQISKIVKFQKLANFWNLTICKTIKIPKISNLMVNYQICILSVRITKTIIKIKNKFKSRKIE